MNLYKNVKNIKEDKEKREKRGKMPLASDHEDMAKGLQLQKIAKELVKNELALLHRKNQGKLMDSLDSIQYIVLHRVCGLRTIGYHFYIQRDGTITQHRRLLEVGEYAQLYDHCSIGICYEGELDVNGNPNYVLADAQYDKLYELLQALHELFPQAKVIGHHVYRWSAPKDEG